MSLLREMLIGALALSLTYGVCVAPTRADGRYDDDAFTQAAKSAEIAGYSISKVQRWLHEVALKDIDAETGLYRTRGRWNYRDTAADCYPFLCWAAWLVDPEALDGPVRNVLHVEQDLCNHLDRIPFRRILIFSFRVLLVAWLFTVLEGFFLAKAFNVIEHACYACSSGALALWVYKVAMTDDRREP